MYRYSPNDGWLQIILFLAFIIPAVFFLLTQQNTLKRIRPENRTMRPGLVWLQLIPFFVNIWQFFVISRISRSITKEMAAWHEDPIFGPDAVIGQGKVPSNPTLGIGIAYGILDTLLILANLFQSPAQTRDGSLVVGVIAWAMIPCWIIYWVKLALYKNKLKRRPA